MRHPSQLSGRDQARRVLDSFFEQESVGRSEPTRSRNRRVHEHLVRFLDEGDMSRTLDTHENAVLAAARRDGRGFLDVFGLEEAVVCLARFVRSDWLPERITDARAQVALAGRLITWLDARGHLDHDLMGCGLYEAEAAVREARERLRPGSETGTASPRPPQPQRPAAPRAAPGSTAAGTPRPRLTLIRGGRTDD